LSGDHLLGIDATYSWTKHAEIHAYADVVIRLIKRLFMRHHRAHQLLQGPDCRLGAEGVGRATTEAVVYSSIAILISNFFLTLVLDKIANAL